MTALDPYLVVRAAALYISVASTVAIWAWRRPDKRLMTGALLATVWNLPVVLALHLMADRFDWWHFDARGGLLLGLPVELYLSWVWLWGAIPVLALPSAPLALVVFLAFGVDLVLMPAGSPVIRLGPMWLVGEVVGLAAGVVPGQLLGRWTARESHLTGRASLQIIAFSGLMLFVLPAIAIDGSGTRWINPLTRPVWHISLLAQLLAVPALLGLTAVQEFVTSGGGTPVPFDPPRRIVTSGIYAYLRNPMQLSAVLLLMVLGLALRNPWVAAAAVMAHLYSAGLAGWDEDEDLRRRFGDDWATYGRAVRRWIPRFRPRYPLEGPPARLYVSSRCEMCDEVGQWFRRRGARALAIVPAEEHPSRHLMRITYERGDGTHAMTGVAAVARALEHLHLGWALIGFALRLPGICQLVQLLVDASGGEARRVLADTHGRSA